ncbi:MAG TPA: hypothetical protein PK060_15445 [Polaromonas sp.]|jgi:hypothetical protein|uniref:hypothetical protein n=1 Tax=unclassified Polaromonas TaxID=2638319 RepID=UPI0025CC160E|nr:MULTISPECIES: hypothetical protein [unclassified Polaromonas]HQS65448.1 hypothetical protein [Acidovorax defluvii]HQT08606.1 hypothetical protein [Polaromonas sp.]
MPVAIIPQSEETEFQALLSAHGLDRSQFTLKLTEHPAATFGPRVKTIKISWKDVLEAEYGAAEPTSWLEQFRADWDSGLIPGIVADTKAAQNDAANTAG